MKRSLARTRAAVDRVQSDLRRTLGESWWCALGDDWLLTVGDGVREETSGLHEDVDDDDWYVLPGASREEQEDALSVDADELIASEVTEILRVLEVSWPRCPQHGIRMGNCVGLWLCPASPSGEHAIDVGSLGVVDGPVTLGPRDR